LRDSLRLTLAGTGTDIGALQSALVPQATVWAYNHLRVLNEEEPLDEDGSQFIVQDRIQYEETDAAVAALETAVRAEIAQVNAQLDGLRSTQVPVTAGLVALSLLATLSVGLIGRRMGGLMREVESRRGEAVRARRQVDAIMAATADGVIGVDLDGRITSMNQAGRVLLDYSDREVVGRNVHSLALHTSPTGEPIPEEESQILRGLRAGETINLHETVLWRRDGTALAVQLQLRPLIDGRRVKGGVITFTDVSELRETAEALRQAVVARDEVLAVVSHDLRNPVGTVYSASDLLLEVDFPKDKRQEHLSIIKRSAARMNRLIEDLLDVARMESGGLSVSPTLEDPADLLTEACELARPRAVTKGVTLDCAPDARLPAVRADRDRVLQVMSNLVGNAIKFTPEGGQVEVGASMGEHEVIVRVADTGPGIPEDDREHVFNRFWQVKRSDRAGAGLGLAIVKGIVEAHGGRVWVGDREEGGSLFCFTLPTG
ncbi:MAG: PAS domain-containing sensor histidine kinase, partial [Gemmatimonadetes bacterium]|nr:PAS domain-containing sensor histidine kinase [Gemmatimonadota bacterium]